MRKLHIKSNIFCLEGDWDNNLKNKSSILPALELLEINNGIQSIYRTCSTYEEFKNRLNILFSDERIYKSYDIIYLAFHGKTNKIFIGESEITLDVIANDFKGKFKNKIIHFGSCKTLSIDEEKAQKLIKETNALAISGYQSNVKFISSTVFDVLFFEVCQKYIDLKSLEEFLEKEFSQIIRSLKFKLHLKND